MFRVIVGNVIQQQRVVAGRKIMLMSTSSAPAPASVPSVKDLLIKLTFVDPSGARRKVNGIIGEHSSSGSIVMPCRGRMKFMRQIIFVHCLFIHIFVSVQNSLNSTLCFCREDVV